MPFPPAGTSHYHFATPQSPKLFLFVTSSPQPFISLFRRHLPKKSIGRARYRPLDDRMKTRTLNSTESMLELGLVGSC